MSRSSESGYPNCQLDEIFQKFYPIIWEKLSKIKLDRAKSQLFGPYHRTDGSISPRILDKISESVWISVEFVYNSISKDQPADIWKIHLTILSANLRCPNLEWHCPNLEWHSPNLERSSPNLDWFSPKLDEFHTKITGKGPHLRMITPDSYIISSTNYPQKQHRSIHLITEFIRIL